MRLKVCLLSLFCIGMAALAAYAEPSPALQASTARAPQTDDQKILYVLGQILGRDIENARLSEEELNSVLQGLSDGALHRPAKVNIDEFGPRLQAFMDAHVKAAGAAELAENQAYVDAEAKKPGAVKTPSGIILQEIKAGAGDAPTADDTVRVHYHGTLRDGSVFDSSVNRGEPATFPLKQVIPCWTEGVQHIHVGGKTRLVCPPNLAYGEGGRPGIPGNAVLTFEVELLEIVKK